MEKPRASVLKFPIEMSFGLTRISTEDCCRGRTDSSYTSVVILSILFHLIGEAIKHSLEVPPIENHLELFDLLLHLLVLTHARLGLQVPVSHLIIELVLLFLKAHLGVSEGPQLGLAGIELVLVPD